MKVTIYSGNNCAYCKLAKEYMTEKGIAYEVRNISEDREAKKTLIQNGFIGIPVIEVEKDGKVEFLQGFDPKAIDEITA